MLGKQSYLPQATVPAGEPGMCVNAASEARGASPLYTPRGVCFK